MIKKAIDPTDVIWENLSQNFMNQLFRRSFGYAIIYAFFIPLCFGIILLLKYYEKKLNYEN